jgi:hypothetical protein
MQRRAPDYKCTAQTVMLWEAASLSPASWLDFSELGDVLNCGRAGELPIGEAIFTSRAQSEESIK